MLASESEGLAIREPRSASNHTKLKGLLSSRFAIVVIGIAFVLVHLIGIFRENVNWDELALLARGAESLRSGRLVGDGRPGLATLLLLPFVGNGQNSITSVVHARLFWSLFTFGYLAGLYAVISQLDGGRRWSSAAFVAVGGIALVPLFQRWSLQVRTDQPALAFGIWGAVALLASRRRSGLGILAGTLFAVGFLSSQKVGYLVVLAGLLAAGEVWMDRDVQVRREAKRAFFVIAGGTVTYFVYRAATAIFLEPATTNLARTIAGMEIYRDLGALVYRSFPALLLPHLLLAGLLLLATIRAMSTTTDERRRCIVAWLVLALGVLVAVVHGSRFAYFWMTLGAFPAIALGIGLRPSVRWLPSRTGNLLLAFVGLLLLARAIPQADEITTDTISHQHRTIDFVDRNFGPGKRGFHPEKALFHRPDPSPFATYFYPGIRRAFFGPEGPANADRFIDEFRTRPVAFMVDSHRLRMFPPIIQQFWASHYVRYAEGVYVAGRFLQGPPGTKTSFEVIAPGEYKLNLPDDHPSVRIAINGSVLSSGDALTLAAGIIEIELVDSIGMGLFTLKLDDPPDPASIAHFYDPTALAELDGTRHWPWLPGL